MTRTLIAIYWSFYGQFFVLYKLLNDPEASLQTKIKVYHSLVPISFESLIFAGVMWDIMILAILRIIFVAIFRRR